MAEATMASEERAKALDRTREIEITLTGRLSGRPITNPVWFVREGDRLYLVPVRGSDSDWYKNVLQTPAIGVKAGDTAWIATAKPITDPGKVRDVVAKLRAKYGDAEVDKYYSKVDVAVEVPLG